jgi:hypothetical protein
MIAPAGGVLVGGMEVGPVVGALVGGVAVSVTVMSSKRAAAWPVNSPMRPDAMAVLVAVPTWVPSRYPVMVDPMASMRRVYQLPAATGREMPARTVMELPFMYCSSTRLPPVSARRYILVEPETREVSATTPPVPKVVGLTRPCTE